MIAVSRPRGFYVGWELTIQAEDPAIWEARGRIRIGDHARIGATAVVGRAVPAGATAVGVPAVLTGGASHGPL